MENKILRCFTDGASKGNTKNSNAGYAYYIPKLNIKYSNTMKGTNNQAELQAVMRLLYFIKFKLNKNSGYNLIIVYTDSKYVIGSMSDNKIVKNKEIINEIKSIRMSLLKSNIKTVFEHVKGHSKKDEFLSKCNNIVDKLASDAAKGKMTSKTTSKTKMTSKGDVKTKTSVKK